MSKLRLPVLWTPATYPSLDWFYNNPLNFYGKKLLFPRLFMYMIFYLCMSPLNFFIFIYVIFQFEGSRDHLWYFSIPTVASGFNAVPGYETESKKGWGTKQSSLYTSVDSPQPHRALPLSLLCPLPLSGWRNPDPIETNQPDDCFILSCWLPSSCAKHRNSLCSLWPTSFLTRTCSG